MEMMQIFTEVIISIRLLLKAAALLALVQREELQPTTM